VSQESDLRPPDPNVVAGLGAVVIGVSAAWFFAYPGLFGPSWAGCLLPALWGLGHGVWLASTRVRRRVPRRRVVLRPAVLLSYSIGAIAFAIAEQQLAESMTWRITPGWRAGSIACVTAFVAQLSWKRLFVSAEPPQ
jgi:peptidoglycan/LPS O-acetylase OafA/YrhL